MYALRSNSTKLLPLSYTFQVFTILVLLKFTVHSIRNSFRKNIEITEKIPDNCKYLTSTNLIINFRRHSPFCYYAIRLFKLHRLLHLTHRYFDWHFYFTKKKKNHHVCNSIRLQFFVKNCS